MTFDMKAFSRMNRERCEAPNGFNHPLNSWSLADWTTATVGELGEAANIVKKLNRVCDGIPGNKVSPEQLRGMLADELADTLLYLDLLAQSEGVQMNINPDASLWVNVRTHRDPQDASIAIASAAYQLGRIASHAVSPGPLLRGSFQNAIHGTVIYLRAVASIYGIDIEAAMVKKFADKSAEIGYRQ